MGPKIEKETKVTEFRMVSLNLNDGQPFDIRAFDEAFLWLHGRKSWEDGRTNFLAAQFVVIDDVMHVFLPAGFTVRLDWNTLSDQFPTLRFDHMQAAGAVECVYNSLNLTVSRRISSCADMRKKAKTESSEYMNGKFKTAVNHGKEYTFTVMM